MRNKGAHQRAALRCTALHLTAAAMIIPTYTHDTNPAFARAGIEAIPVLSTAGRSQGRGVPDCGFELWFQALKGGKVKRLLDSDASSKQPNGSRPIASELNM